MKAYLIIFVTGLSASCATVSVTENKQPLSLSISWLRTSSTIVHVELCNVSDSNLEVRNLLIPQYYYLRFSVSEISGFPIRFKGPEYKIVPPELIVIAPDECIEAEHNIQQLFDIPKNSRITYIQAFYWNNMIDPTQSSLHAVSNMLTLRQNTDFETGSDEAFFEKIRQPEI
ncbi:hypothetical protein BTA51_11235 [Hahella sp. CCB-MM4]|nr:hypothetical protein BTA51_11235 [Hahella sp. CCB-MM4]